MLRQSAQQARRGVTARVARRRPRSGASRRAPEANAKCLLTGAVERLVSKHTPTALTGCPSLLTNGYRNG